jgi:murein L,D-transpeptidase YafK
MLRNIWYCLVVLFALVLACGLVFRFWPHTPLVASSRADFVLVDKSERSLSLLKNGEVVKSYRVALGSNPFGPKVREGDGRTPEGQYRIDRRNAASDFYRALHISYPHAMDRERANQTGVSPGGDIMIHGMKNDLGWIGRLHRLVDWTNGCIAVTNEEMREIWSAVPDNTAIEIRP